MDVNFSLAQMQAGQKACIVGVNMDGAMGRRLGELGFLPQTQVTCLGAAPAGSPVRYEVRGAVIALRKKDANAVCIRLL